MKENPLTPALKQISYEIRRLDFHGARAIPSLITFVVLGLVFIIFILLWPYGLVPVVADSIWRLITSTQCEMRDKGLIEMMPYTVAIGVYFVVWVPFAILCLPFAILGLIGYALARTEDTGFSQALGWEMYTVILSIFFCITVSVVWFII